MNTRRSVDLQRLRQDPAYRWSEGKAFLRFTRKDWESVQATEPILRPHLHSMVESLYERLMEYEPTAELYLDETGALDEDNYRHRVEGFVLWFERIFDSPQDRDYLEYLRDVGAIHTAAKGFEEMVVEPFYVRLTFGILFDRIVRRLARSVRDPDRLARWSSAWQRLFQLQQELMQPELQRGSGNSPEEP